MSSSQAGKPPTVVLFVRHARTPTTGSVLPGRAGGLHLSPEGVTQAKEAARSLGALGSVDAVYASPMERAQETAAPIAEMFGTRIETDESLTECDFGSWTGAALAELAKLPEWETVQRWPSTWCFPQGESFAEMQLRITACAQRLASRHPGGRVVAVSHADPIKAAVAQALGVHLDLFQRTVISPGSITAIAYGGGGPSVLTVNSTPDLASTVGKDAVVAHRAGGGAK